MTVYVLFDSIFLPGLWIFGLQAQFSHIESMPEPKETRTLYLGLTPEREEDCIEQEEDFQYLYTILNY